MLVNPHKTAGPFLEAERNELGRGVIGEDLLQQIRSLRTPSHARHSRVGSIYEALTGFAVTVKVARLVGGFNSYAELPDRPAARRAGARS